MADIVVRENTVDQGGGFSASIEGIAAAGTGDTEAEAIQSLAALLGDFVHGHAARIRELESGIDFALGKLGLQRGPGFGATTVDPNAPLLTPLRGPLAQGGSAKEDTEVFERATALARDFAARAADRATKPRIVCGDCAGKHNLQVGADPEGVPFELGGIICRVCGNVFCGKFAIASVDKCAELRALEPATESTRYVDELERIVALGRPLG
jgi:hypothetical protein